MKERKLNITRNVDPTIVIDDNDKLYNELNKIYQKSLLNLQFCMNQLKKKKLTKGMKETFLSLSESYVIDFLNEFGYDSILKKEKEKRYKEIKELNLENKELRKQIGEKISNDDVREKLKNIANIFKLWWNIEGFGHVIDLKFDCYSGIIVKLSGHVTSSYQNNNNMYSKKDKIEYLKNLGFDLNDDEFIISSDNSNKLLTKLFNDNFPSSEIIQYKITNYNKCNAYREIEVQISDLNDFNKIKTL